MKNQENKQIWVKPSVQVLNIKKDTFGGSGNANENAADNTQSWKPDKVKSPSTARVR